MGNNGKQTSSRKMGCLYSSQSGEGKLKVTSSSRAERQIESCGDEKRDERDE